MRGVEAVEAVENPMTMRIFDERASRRRATTAVATLRHLLRSTISAWLAHAADHRIGLSFSQQSRGPA